MSTVKVFHDYQQDRARIGANERKKEREKENTNARISTFDTHNTWHFVKFSAAIEIERGITRRRVSSRSAKAFKEIESKETFFFSSLSPFLSRVRRTTMGLVDGWIRGQWSETSLTLLDGGFKGFLAHFWPLARPQTPLPWPHGICDLIDHLDLLTLLSFPLPCLWNAAFNADRSILLTVQINKMYETKII